MWGLFRHSQCVVPTWRGWLLSSVVFLALGILGVREIHPFLAPIDPLPGGVLVVEGWAPDYGLEAVLAEFRTSHYDKIYVTGGPVDWGAPLAEYRTYAERGAAVFLKWGLSTNLVQAVPAPRARQDRTFTSAVALRNWWREHHLAPTKVHLMTNGAHARRSRLLYEKGLGNGVTVGVTALEDRNYDPQHWWRSSAGVRDVIDESFAYLYAKFLFHARGE